MKIILYKFNKKSNSTAIPSNSTTKIEYDNAQVKSPSSINSPLVQLAKDNDPNGYNYIYIPSFKRYYFVQDITYNLGLWLVSCVTDVLASFRSDILSSTQYILRSSSSYDGNIVDTFYPTTSSVKSSISYLNSDVKMNISGSTLIQDYFTRKITTGGFIIGVLGGNNGGVTYYGTSYTGLKQIVEALTSYVPTDFGDLANGIKRELADPLQYIVSCTWYPYVTNDGGSSYQDMKFGNYSIRVNCGLISENDYVKVFNTTAQVPKHPKANSRGKYLNLSPYSRYRLLFEPFGDVNLDSLDLSDIDTLAFRWWIDYTTGEAKLGIFKDRDYTLNLGYYTTYYGIPIRLTQVSIDTVGLASNVVGGITSLATGNLGSIFSNIIGATESLQPRPNSLGSTGTFLQQFMAPCIYALFTDLVDDDVNNIGRPLCKKKVLSSLRGYALCGNSVVNYTTNLPLSIEADEVVGLLNSGVFIE